ncbi:hypothetical protein B9Z55_020368 [Caenorhabditis nigoni]|uniref:Uncharacterized protein n=1 Tax=Caenorhabditis nigoni TaxID=1611254 RepID=A0A2G5TMI2_9PELO|nr:hypothetical protein B9Z55_020368 [Caenorhabditis nigoni]
MEKRVSNRRGKKKNEGGVEKWGVSEMRSRNTKKAKEIEEATPSLPRENEKTEQKAISEANGESTSGDGESQEKARQSLE